MSTNLTNKLNISSLFNKEELVIWKMDTSHRSILEKFININTIKSKKIKFLSSKKNIDCTTKFIIIFFDNNNNEIHRTKEQAFTTTRQYAEILVMYGLIPITFKKMNKTEWFTSISNNKISFDNKWDDYTQYLENNIDNVVSRFKEMISLESKNFFYENLYGFLSLMEVAVNFFYNDYENLSRINFHSYLSKYKKDIYFSKNRNSKITEKNRGDLWNDIKNAGILIPFILRVLNNLGIKNNNVSNDKNLPNPFAKEETIYGDIGEKIVYQLLCQKHKSVSHKSISEKYLNYDIKINKDIKKFVEVKTKMGYKKGKTTFQMSENEFKLLKNRTKDYLLYYVNNLPSCEKLNKIIKDLLEGKKIENLIEENHIDIKCIDGEKLLSKYEFNSKGYWVRELSL